MNTILTDTFNRMHDYLRISLTDNCNLRCFYCMPEESYTFTPASRLMQAAEIFTIAEQFVQLGVKKIRLTGGEPLVRKDAAIIIQQLATLPVELTITTNGTRIQSFIPTLKKNGIKSINVSLDTLNRERFLVMTRRDQFPQVYDSISQLIAEGFHVKVNVVVMKGLNEEELPAFLNWTKNTPVHVRFIEFMPFSGNRWSSNQVLTWQEILEIAARQYEFTPLESAAQDTAKKYQIPGHAGSFAVISTMSNNFCSTCNRLRLTADGKLKNCLFSSSETDLLTPLRNGQQLLPLIQQTIAHKKKELGGQFTQDFEKIETAALQNRTMITIGG
ncbi:GTP 3',8-cyclase MoaA [Flavihumibacter sp. CACIAM 22H1]|uniref:GTP 3',8-cyclase MoaA n=1 Tax=Flavihumibacter sp. CACIAM 22H1 TaxID=1812911 RepID=UPI000AC3F470|nr:GTP 3',8-cyclase MoaA [Flavihumibacter sp. CACIAM 22H1]